MTNFRIIRQELTIEFAIETTDKVTSFNGTPFTPNRCRARVNNRKVVSLFLEKLDDSGYGIDDPAGPEGAELAADFGGGELAAGYRAKLPEIVREALAEIEVEVEGLP